MAIVELKELSHILFIECPLWRLFCAKVDSLLWVDLVNSLRDNNEISRGPVSRKLYSQGRWSYSA